MALFEEAPSIPKLTGTASFEIGTVVSTPVNVKVVVFAPLLSVTVFPDAEQAGACRQTNTPEVVSEAVLKTMGSAAA